MNAHITQISLLEVQPALPNGSIFLAVHPGLLLEILHDQQLGGYG